MITPSFGLTATERVLPKLALDFTTASLDPRVTFTRTTNATNPATYVASTGYVTAATNNQPRFDYDPIGLTCKGLLIEESRANVAQSSEQYNNGYYLSYNITIADNSTNSPANTLTAAKLKETSATGEHMVRQNPTYATNTSYTISIFAKAAERTFLRINTFIGGQGGATAYYNLSNGTVSSSTSSAWTLVGTSISAYANGFYRCSLTFTVNTAGGASNCDFAIAPSNGTASYAGTTDYGIYVWGTQLETGAFATSYIPTTTAALTRNADVATMTGTNFSSWFNASEGTFVADFDTIDVGASRFPNVLVASNGTSAERIFLAVSAGSRRTAVYSSSTSQYDQIGGGLGTTTANAFNRLALGYKVDSFIGAAMGSLATPDVSGVLPTVDRLTLGSSAVSNNFLNGHVAAIRFYPQRLLNAEVQAFSKG